MKSVSGKDLARTLERHGWQLLRIHGSHHIYGKTASIVRLSVPIHGNKPLKFGLLKHLLKLAGLEESDLP
jgi:predicted RNA binding protein YcfA (HicA-like mRNA interferase family)